MLSGKPLTDDEQAIADQWAALEKRIAKSMGTKEIVPPHSPVRYITTRESEWHRADYPIGRKLMGHAGYSDTLWGFTITSLILTLQLLIEQKENEDRLPPSLDTWKTLE